MVVSRKNVALAGFAAFVAWGLAVKSIPVLRFIGYAFTTGAVLTFAATLLVLVTISRPIPPRSSKASLSRPTPAFLVAKQWKSEKALVTAASAYQPTDLYLKSFVVSQAIDSLLTLALRDFVSSWYKNISASPTFVHGIDKQIRSAIGELVNRLVREDVVNVIVTRLIPIITTHLRDFDQAERLVKGRSLSRSVTESEELDLAIAAKYRDGKLHPAASLSFADTKTVEQEHLRKLVVRILPELVSEEVIGSRAVSVLVKEIVACAVLLPVIQLLKDPDTWNQIIENYGRSALQDRKTVRRMRAALDAHTSPSAKAKTDAEFPRLAPNDSERAFERFVRAIRKTTNLSDARRFRSQVASQLKRESMVEGQDPLYLRRLEMGKRVLDQKIAKLAIATGALPGSAAPAEPRRSLDSAVAHSRELTLVEIMHTSCGLSYFMEYMDRQRRMPLVQFWIVVDGFRNPLEDDLGDDPLGTSAPTWTDADRTDVAQIFESYLSKSQVQLPQESQDDIRAFLVAGRKATQEQYRAARTAILSAQSAVLDELQAHYFPSFKRSDLYYKFLSSDEARVPSLDSSAMLESPSISRPLSPVASIRPLPAAASMSRNGSHTAIKAKDLRRAALSSSDIRSLDTSKKSTAQSNASLDPSTPLFDDDYDTDPLAHSTQSLGQDSFNGEVAEERRMVEDMEAAMSNIMAEPQDHEPVDDEQDVLFGSPTSSHRSARPAESPRPSLDVTRTEPVISKLKPSLANLGLVNTSSRIGVFSDNDLFPDEEKFLEDEYADQDNKDIPEEEIHEAAPGDLGLTEAISALSSDIERLVTQESVVDTLTRKAELTNNVPELRILGKSKASLQREIRRKELQRQQYIVQESDNSLYGRSIIKIKSVMVGREEDGGEFALYVIEVQRQAGDQMPAATWAITRRYSEFHELHQRLRRRYPSTRTLDFPRRRMVMKLQKQFLHNRRVALEAYLQQLLRMPDVCRSRELRSFLSQQAISSEDNGAVGNTQDIVSRIYNSVTDGMDEFLGNMAVLDQLSVAGQNLISAATTQLGMAQNEVVAVETGSVAEAEAELQAFEDKELEPFVKPICDVFLEVFELNRGNNWLRGRAVVVVLHQLLGGTVERKMRDFAKGLIQEDSLLRYLETAKETMWPGGRMRQAEPRSAAEKMKTRREAGLVLATLLPDLAASVVGRGNAQAAARRITASINNTRLNQHLAYTMLDEIVGVLFDVTKKGKG
jgi:sorting nexin-25